MEVAIILLFVIILQRNNYTPLRDESDFLLQRGCLFHCNKDMGTRTRSGTHAQIALLLILLS